MFRSATSGGNEHGGLVWALGLAATAVIGVLDYYTGVELRVFALYFIPVALLTWQAGRWGAVIATVLCDGTWLLSNALAGLQYSTPGIWVGNTLMQAASFGTVGLLIATLHDALRRERTLSRTDQLTNLLNNRGFLEDAPRVLAPCRRGRRPLTAACIDLDNFKAVNDTLGHQAGDDLLRRVASELIASTRPSDVVGRLGGDEFVILFPETGPPEAAAVLERLRAALQQTLGSGLVRASASIGAVTFLAVPDEVAEILRQCDSRMYEAKAAGKNQVKLAVVGAAPASAAE